MNKIHSPEEGYRIYITSSIAEKLFFKELDLVIDNYIKMSHECARLENDIDTYTSCKTDTENKKEELRKSEENKKTAKVEVMDFLLRIEEEELMDQIIDYLAKSRVNIEDIQNLKELNPLFIDRLEKIKQEEAINEIISETEGNVEGLLHLNDRKLESKRKEILGKIINEAKKYPSSISLTSFLEEIKTNPGYFKGSLNYNFENLYSNLITSGFDAEILELIRSYNNVILAIESPKF